jgi:signal transduction histidine kinase
VSAGSLHRLRHPSWARRLRHSLRLRLMVVFVVLGLAMSSAFVFGMQRAFSGGWRELVRPLLTDYIDRLAADIGSPPDPARANALAERLPIWVQVRGPMVNFDTRGELAPPLDNQGRPVPHGARPGAALPAPWRLREPHGPGPWLLTRVSADGHTLHFGLDMADFERRPRAIGWLTLAAILLLTLGAYAYVRRLLAPLADIGAGAQRYGGGDFATPIPVRRGDELGDLATQVNTMARDIHAMLDAKRALLLAISHELRSPLTRARLNAELVDEGPARDALLHDLAAMRDLITDLLESERLAAGHVALHCEATDLGALLTALVHEHCPQGAADLAQVAPLQTLTLDAPRLRLALRNLLVNALRHGRRDGEPARLQLALAPGRLDHPPRQLMSDTAPLSDPSAALRAAGPLSSEGKAASSTKQGNASSRSGSAGGSGGDASPAGLWLTVRDFGPGVAPGQLASLGQAFWRADNARQRSTGGVGLGLYLVRLVVEAHRGRLLFSDAGPGLRVDIWLPAGTPGIDVSSRA